MESRVSIFYVQPDGEVWADYLYQKLIAKEYEINCEKIEFTGKSESSLHSSVFNVFFVTPDFLDTQNWKWSNSVDTSRCLLVLTGTEHDDLEESARYHECEHVNEFYIHELKETEESVRDLLIIIISKYEESDHHHESPSPPTHQSPREPLHYRGSEPKNFKYKDRLSAKSTGRAYTGMRNSPNVVRKTISEGQYDRLPNYQRQVNGVRDVVCKNGKLFILLWRQAEGELKVRLQDKDIVPVDTHCAVYEIAYEGKQSANLSVIQDGDVIGQHLVQAPTSAVDGAPTVIESTKLPHPTSVSVETQTDESDINEGRSIISKTSRDSLYVNIDDVSRESSEPCPEGISKMSRENKLEYIRKILEDETDPEELLCQCLGIDKGVRHLDEKMTSMVQSVETLRHLSFSGRQSSSDEKESSTWPTLVHFGAQFNLLNFCDVLLSNPLMYGACVRKNKDGNMPHDIARIHGHKELAEMLKHFSEFVKAEKERDSGVSGLSSTPRLSTISGEPPPPPPHRTRNSDNNYIDMSGIHVQDDYVNEREAEKLRSHPRKHLREVSADGGFCGSLEASDDDDYLNMSQKISPLATVHTTFESPHSSLTSSFHDLMHSHDSAVSDPERRTLIGTDDESDPDVPHHKDVVNMLGMEPISPDDTRKTKTSKLKKLFFGKKTRSKSEPAIDILSVKRSTNSKSYYRDSARSSSSTASTYSDSSFRDEDGSEVQLRGDGKSGKKVKGFLKKAKRRQSQRVKQAMEDNQIKAPALPSRSEVF
ncbi:uncharacterized protein LOC123564593 isoform X2 [Mercenaria mercenaria]|uniref:uncharacterized protein LOC123564593 isoform X2 n=1 Tax=Mercenaria mercenaria TaxID=6596 RepID=UPI00234E96DE|nr:uncharacterized protein LOC123564593 isoform X2 [Mercenaria mercenaria]